MSSALESEILRDVWYLAIPGRQLQRRARAPTRSKLKLCLRTTQNRLVRPSSVHPTSPATQVREITAR